MHPYAAYKEEIPLEHPPHIRKIWFSLSCLYDRLEPIYIICKNSNLRLTVATVKSYYGSSSLFF
jgi:hypothetical protein